MNIYFNRGIPIARNSRNAIRTNGVIMLKRRKAQNVNGIVINHGNMDCQINAPIVINPPELVYQTGVIEAAHRVGEFMPDVRFKLSDVNYSPFIAKVNGMKGRGKIVVKSEDHYKELVKAGRNLTNYSIYQRFIEPPSLEYRVVTFKNHIVSVYKKVLEDKWNPASYKAFHLCADGQYYKDLPQRIKDFALEIASYFDLDLLGIDLLFPGDKLKKETAGFVLEVNSAPGLGAQFTLPRLIQLIKEEYNTA